MHPGQLNVQVEIGLHVWSFNILGILTTHMMKINMLDPAIDFTDLAEKTCWK